MGQTQTAGRLYHARVISQSKACWEKNLKPESKQTKLPSHNTGVNEPADRAFNT